jgi:hypothetical protein
MPYLINSRRRKLTSYPWKVRRVKGKVVIELKRSRIPLKKKPQGSIPPDCQPELW